jgi:PAP2 superfamily
MASAFLSRMPLRREAIGPLTRSMLLIALLAVLPGARADVVLDWNLTTAQALHAAKAGSGLAHSRVYAMVHGAMFDAVNAVDRRYHHYAADLEAVPGASQDAAAAAAAHAVLTALYPQQQPTFDAALAASLAKLQDGPAKADGIALGKAAAEKMLALRRNDRMSEKVSYVAKAGPGAWQLAANTNPVGPQWGLVVPFVLKSARDFRFAGPPPLKSARYAQDFDEVKALGAKQSIQRTAEQAAIALLWEPTSPLTYNAVLRGMPELKQRSIVDQARVFALMNMAGSDALIVGWDAKYAIQFWRPDTAIRNADSDGNDATSADPAWEALRSSMPAHPEYPSGHGVFTGAVEAVLRDFFGTDRVSITVSNPEAKITRKFESFSQISKSVEDARVWLGIHFRSTVVDSSEMGRRVAEYVLKNCMRPIAS